MKSDRLSSESLVAVQPNIFFLFWAVKIVKVLSVTFELEIIMFIYCIVICIFGNLKGSKPFYAMHVLTSLHVCLILFLNLVRKIYYMKALL